jgi:hypothetical protein
VGSKLVTGRAAVFRLAARVPQNGVSFGGEWTLAGQAATAGRRATLRLHFQAHDVYIVLGGSGTVTASVNGAPIAPIRVSGDRLYTVLGSRTLRDATLELRFTPGVRAYSFTFG